MEKSELDAKVAEIAEPQPEPERRSKVAVLGFTESWQKAPFSDQSFEIWGLNELYQFIPRWDRWFDIHNRSVYENDRSRVSDHIVRLRAMTCPVYMQQHWDDIPNSLAYPIDAVAKAFPNPCPDARPYFTNSITFMILLAIMEGFKELHIYGVDMAHDCLAPDMRVLTADLQWVPAGSLKVGQELLAFDEEVPVHSGNGEPAQFRKYRKTTVESLSELTRPCHRLEMADGTALISSVGHQWLTLGGIKNIRRWLRTDELQAQDRYPSHASKIVKLMPVWSEDRSWASGYLAAALDGEGHISQGPRANCSSSHMSVGFSQKLNGMTSCVQQAMAEVGFRFRDTKASGDGCYKYTVKGSRAESLRLLGTVRPRRLLEKFDANQVGTLNSIDDTPIVRNDFIGDQAVIGITTGTRTLIVEGFASHNSEYNSQRPSCEWAVGLAQGAGIKVYIPHEADLLKTNFVYGYEADAAHTFDRKLTERRNEMAKRMTDLDTQIAQLTEARAQYRGAIQDAEHILKNWKSN